MSNQNKKIFLSTRYLLLATLMWLILSVCGDVALAASDWYVRPRTGEYGAADGTTYETAWDGTDDIVWGSGGVVASDTLYVCGTFDQDGEGTGVLLNVGADGTSGNVITIRGDYSGDPGVLISAKKISSWTDNGDGTYYKTAWQNLSPAAWENAPGSGDVVLKPVTTQALVASTNGSHLRRIEAVSAFSDAGGGEVQADFTSNHDFSNGDSVRIYGTTNYNGTFVITVVDADSIKFTDGWVADDARGIATDDIFWYNPSGAAGTVYTAWNTGLHFRGHDYVTVQNLSFYGGYHRANIELEQAGNTVAQYVTVDNCIIKYSQTDGIQNALAGNNYTITNNTFEEFTTGVYIVGGGTSPDNVTISNNTFDCGTSGYNSYWTSRGAQDRPAIALQPGDDYTISDNHIVRAVDCGIIFFQHSGPLHSMTNMHILRNRIDIVHDPDDAYESCGIYYAGGNDVDGGPAMAGMIIAHNIIQDCYETVFNGNDPDGSGMYLKTADHATSDTRPLISNNVVVGCDKNYSLDRFVTVGERNCEYVFYNNISYNPIKYHMRVYVGTDGYDLDMDYNIWYPDTTVDKNKFYWANDPVADNFTDFIAKAAADGVIIGENSFVADPLFVDPEDCNFHLRPDSPAIDRGVDVGLLKDFDGNPVWYGAAPDIGAYEYGSSLLKYDVNGDGYVNIQDVQACVNHISGTQDWGSRADVNKDWKVDGKDVAEILNIILEK